MGREFRILLRILLAVVGFLIAGLAFAGEGEVVVGIGTSEVIAAPRGAVVGVSDGRVLRVQDLGARVRVTGKKIGSAVVTVADRVVVVHVLKGSKFRAFVRLRAAVAEMRGLEVGVSSGVVRVSGRLLRFDDWLRLSEAARDDESFVFTASFEPEAEREAREYFRKLFAEAHLPDIDLTFVAGRSASAHVSNGQRDTSRALEKLLTPYGIVLERSSATLTLEPLVRVSIQVTELRKKFLQRFGLQWQPAYQAQLLPNFGFPGMPGQVPLTVQLNALEERGEGRILASPNLLCRSGKEAQFLAGGEFPIKLSNIHSSEVIWKRYGVLLRIKPKADLSGRMSIAIESEVSTIDSSRTVEGVPGLLTNRIESHFDLKQSKTIALSGLIMHEKGESAGGLPGLSSLPVLGALFSSREYREEKSELVVFVTPEVVREGENP